MQLKHKEYGSYRNIKFSIFHNGVCWSYNIYLPLDNEVFVNLTDCDIDKIETHCGFTYEAIKKDKHGNKYLRLGCDYGHLWDHYHVYKRDDIYEGVKNTIDSVHELFLS